MGGMPRGHALFVLQLIQLILTSISFEIRKKKKINKTLIPTTTLEITLIYLFVSLFIIINLFIYLFTYLSIREYHLINFMNPGYFTLTATDLKPQQMPMFLHISARVWGRRWSPPHIRTEGLYVKTTIIHQLKRLCVPDCAYTENMFINSIHISLWNITLTKNILYQIKWDVGVWKRLGCPQHNQRTWWQIVATSYTGLA